MCGRDKLVVLTTSGKSLVMLSVLVTHMARRSLGTSVKLPEYDGISGLNAFLTESEHLNEPWPKWPPELQ